LSGGDPPNPPCGRRGRLCARPLVCSAALVLGRSAAHMLCGCRSRPQN
jgi:hypothetical protein